MQPGDTISWDDSEHAPAVSSTARDSQHAAYAPGHPLKAALETTLAAVEMLRPEWRTLEQASRADAGFFQSYAWCHHVATVRLARRSAARYRLCVVTLRGADNRLIGLWPLSLQREGLCWIARNLDAPFGPFAGILLIDPSEAAACIDAAARALKAASGADGLRIERVVEGSPLWQGLIERKAQIVRSDQAVYLDFRSFGSFEAYHQTVATKTRKNLRNALNRMRRAHDVDHRVTTDVGSESHLIAQAFDERLAWMEVGGKTTPAFRDPGFRPLLEALPAADPPVDLLGFELKTPNDAISTQWGFRHQGHYYAYMSARNLDFDAFSPGQVHLGMVVKACHELGIEVIEMMAPASAYKLKWAKTSKQIDDLSLALSSKGFLYLDLWRRKLRNLVKWGYERIPDWSRRLVASLTNRNLR